MQAAETAIRHQIENELGQPGTPGVDVAVRAIRRRHGEAVAGILFYGSCLRDREDEGRLLDLYVLVRRYHDFYRSPVAAAFNRILPPNVYYLEVTEGGRTVRAKYAVLSLDALRKGTSPATLHSSIWGRFAQPCALVYFQDHDVRETVAEALSSAVVTMLSETMPLLPPDTSSEEVWRRAFRESYRTEFRPERANRPADLYAAYRARYDRIAGLIDLPGLAARGPNSRTRCLRRWRLRRVVGRTLHVFRLVKATFTFVGGLDYLLWKIETHSGVKTEPTPWQRRHPLLAAPGLAVRLYRRGAFR